MQKKNKTVVKPRSRSSSHSSLDLLDSPLSIFKPMGDGDKNLFSYHEQDCEFCDAVFFNKYDHCVHNAHHIIIPLINQNVQQCKECLFYFTSSEELVLHSATKHGINMTGTGSKNEKNNIHITENPESGRIITKRSKECKNKNKNEKNNVNITKEAVSGGKIAKKTFKQLENKIVLGTNKINKLSITEKLESNISEVPNILENLAVRFNDDVNKLVIKKTDRQLECENKAEMMKKKTVEDRKTEEIEKTEKDNKINITNDTQRNKKRQSTVKESSIHETLTNGDVIVIDDDDEDTYNAQNTQNKKRNESGGIKSKIVFEEDPDLYSNDDDHYGDETNIMKLAKTCFTTNYTEPNKCLDVEVLNMCDDDNEKDNYILPDDGFLMNRIMVPDNSYILPDNGPELIIPDRNTSQWSGPSLCSSNEFGPTFSTLNLNGYPVPNTNKQLFGKIILGSKVTQDNHVSSSITFTPSVHYDELNSPGLYGCRRCSKKFPSKFKLVVHEKTHIKIKARWHPAYCNDCPICDRYIVGNHWSVKRHIRKKHPEKPERSYSLSNCRTCGLRYRRYDQHVRNYHKIYVCPTCRHRFETERERSVHIDEKKCGKEKEQSGEGDIVKRYVNGQDSYVECESVKMFKVCELCFLFMKDRGSTVKYVVCGESSKAGERQKCQSCQKKFFELQLVKRIHRWTKKEDFSKKSWTETRLKIMKKCLKKCNKL